MVLAGSLMCVSLDQMQHQIQSLETSGIDMHHIDIMDGQFVENFSLSTFDYNYIADISNIKFDAHLMIKNPLKYIDLFLAKEPEIIYVHFETEDDLLEIFAKVKLTNTKFGLVVNPDTNLNEYKHLLHFIDILLCMTVYPGFSGATYVDYVDDKITETSEYITNNNLSCKIFVDGAITEEKIAKLSKVGVEGFILGTKTLFNKNENYLEILSRVREENV